MVTFSRDSGTPMPVESPTSGDVNRLPVDSPVRPDTYSLIDHTIASTPSAAPLLVTRISDSYRSSQEQLDTLLATLDPELIAKLERISDFSDLHSDIATLEEPILSPARINVSVDELTEEQAAAELEDLLLEFLPEQRRFPGEEFSLEAALSSGLKISSLPNYVCFNQPESEYDQTMDRVRVSAEYPDAKTMLKKIGQTGALPSALSDVIHEQAHRMQTPGLIRNGYKALRYGTLPATIGYIATFGFQGVAAAGVGIAALFGAGYALMKRDNPQRKAERSYEVTVPVEVHALLSERSLSTYPDGRFSADDIKSYVQNYLRPQRGSVYASTVLDRNKAEAFVDKAFYLVDSLMLLGADPKKLAQEAFREDSSFEDCSFPRFEALLAAERESYGLQSESDFHQVRAVLSHKRELECLVDQHQLRKMAGKRLSEHAI